MIMDSKIEIIYKNADIKVANGRERVFNAKKYFGMKHRKIGKNLTVSLR